MRWRAGSVRAVSLALTKVMRARALSTKRAGVQAVVALILGWAGLVGLVDGQDAPVFKPVWQWVDPGLKAKYGFGWPAEKQEGEFKQCTCAHVDYSLNMACSDDQAEGRVKDFDCRQFGTRSRTGHDEFKYGMRGSGNPCMCSTTVGKVESDACFGFKTTVETTSYDHPPLCLPVTRVREDKWDYISVSALQDTSVVGPTEASTILLPPGEYPDIERNRLMILVIDVQWGMLDIFDEEQKALESDDSSCVFTCQGGDPKTAGQRCNGIEDVTTCKGGGVCSYLECNCCCEETPLDLKRRTNPDSPLYGVHVCGGDGVDPATGATIRRCNYPPNEAGNPVPSPRQIRFQYRDGVAGKHRLTVVGDWLSLMATMLNLKYRGLRDTTTMRLRSPTLSPLSAQTQPYETVYYSITQVQSQPEFINGIRTGETEYFTVFSGNLTVLVRIISDNDAPVIVDPQQGYVAPAVCSNLDAETSAKCCRKDGDQSCCQCHFGQFYAFEDTSDILQITGMQVSDVDIEELTTTAEFDVFTLVKNGNINFNSRTGLTFYDQNARNRKGFTATTEFTNNAIRLLKYVVELPELVDRECKPGVPKTECSTVHHFHTQQEGKEEYFDISFNDQGYTSVTGQAKSVSARVFVTIVAQNDAPAIHVQRQDFDATEDTLTDITGISVSDVDLMESITSTLAHDLWMDDAENRQYTNRMAAEVSVTHGRMYLGVWAKLNVIRDAVQEYVTLASFFPSHDLCKINDIFIMPPGSPQRLEDVCAHINAGTPDCATGDSTNKLENPNCRCGIINRCGTDKYLVLYLNRSKDFTPYRNALKNVLVATDKTCGGLPVGPNPNNYTLGKACSTSRDCSEARLPRCGGADRPCFCCANLSMPCSSADDCHAVEKDSLCGCSFDPHGQGQCGPYKTPAGQPVLVRHP